MCQCYINCLIFNGAAGKKIPIPLPNTGVLQRRRNALWLRCIALLLFLFAVVQLHVINQSTCGVVRMVYCCLIIIPCHTLDIINVAS